MANKVALRFINEPRKTEVARQRASQGEEGCSKLAAQDFLDGQREKPVVKKLRKGGKHGRQA